MYGVTTVFSLGDDQAAGFELRNENTSALDRARLFVAGPVITGEDFMTITIGKEITIGEQRLGGTQVFEQSRVVHDDE